MAPRPTLPALVLLAALLACAAAPGAARALLEDAAPKPIVPQQEPAAEPVNIFLPQFVARFGGGRLRTGRALAGAGALGQLAGRGGGCSAQARLRACLQALARIHARLSHTRPTNGPSHNCRAE
jgi:hypothetical protein